MDGNITVFLGCKINGTFSTTMTDDFDKLARVFHSLSAPSRLRLLMLLSRQSSTAPQVAMELNTSYANALKQLGILEAAGWLSRNRVHNGYFYKLERAWIVPVVAQYANALHSKTE